MIKLIAVVALLATGVMKAEAATPPTTEADCRPRALAALETAKARDAGQTDRDLYQFVDSDKAQVAYRPIYKRIIFTVYSNHSLTPDNAYNGELTRCLSEVSIIKKK